MSLPSRCAGATIATSIALAMKAAWWAKAKASNPTAAARALWLETHPLPSSYG